MKVVDKVKIKMSKLSLAFLMSVTMTSHVLASGSVEKINCALPGCTVKCSSEDLPVQSYGPAKSITVEIMPGGVIKYTIEKGITGKQSVYVGPDSYICSINEP